jgi:hypothetical protein
VSRRPFVFLSDVLQTALIEFSNALQCRFFPLTSHLSPLTLQTPANSAPQRSQYHSVGRFSVPHSPHLRVFATPEATFAGAAGATSAGRGAAVAVCAGMPGLLGRRTERLGSSETDFKNSSSSPGG